MPKINAAAWRSRRLHSVAGVCTSRTSAFCNFFKRCGNAVSTPLWCDRGLSYFFLNPEHRNYVRKFLQHFFYWTEDSKTYAHADAQHNFDLAWPYLALDTRSPDAEWECPSASILYMYKCTRYQMFNQTMHDTRYVINWHLIQHLTMRCIVCGASCQMWFCSHRVPRDIHYYAKRNNNWHFPRVYHKRVLARSGNSEFLEMLVWHLPLLSASVVI